MVELKNKRIAFHTLGCKVNIYESEVMENAVLSAGARVVPFSEQADIYIVNTCSVTNMADRKSRQMLHRARKLSPDALIVATGCYVETEKEALLLGTGADLLLGNEEKKDIVRALSDYLETGVFPERTDISKVTQYRNERLSEIHEHTRADIKVQDGCNQFCTYCIIPFARGRIRSKRPEDAVSEIEALVNKGVREFVLTGIHLSSYGLDFSAGGQKTADYRAVAENEDNLLTLIEKIHGIEGVERIRIGSLEPRIVTKTFAERLKKLDKVCPYFHLALQSGADETLRRMNRHYTTAEYREAVRHLRSVYENPAITTDVITGFPGETAEEFEKTRAFFTEMGFFEPNIFPYSRRRGTVADKMKDQVPDEVKKARSEVLLAIGEETSRAYRDSFLGKTVEMLTETAVSDEGARVFSGHTREFLTVFTKKAAAENERITGTLAKIGDAYWVV